MPIAMSIQWKPLHDSHYVVASLLPGGGGLRQIFARQSTLHQVQAIARRDPEQPVVGLLLGERLDCLLTGTPYVLIGSHVEVALASLDERSVVDAIRTLRGQVGRNRSIEALGWYCSGRSADVAVSRMHAAVHAACFAERWHTLLAFAEGGTAAFFLHDASASRWFHAPFYEVTDSKASARAPKPTCVAWPAYLTTAAVVPLVETPQEVTPRAPRASVAAAVSAPPRTQSVAVARPVVRARRTPAGDVIVGASRFAVVARRSALELAKALGRRAVTASRHATESIARMRAERAASAARRKVEADAARAREEERRAKEAAERRAARAEAKRIAAEEAQRRAAEAEARRKAAEEAQRIAAEEAQRIATEEEQRRAAEAEARRQAAEAEARRQAAEAEARRLAEAEAQRVAAETEARRLADEAEAKAQRQAQEAEEVARRRAAEAAEEARRKTAEADALRISAEVSALRERLARPPVEGSRR